MKEGIRFNDFTNIRNYTKQFQVEFKLQYNDTSNGLPFML